MAFFAKKTAAELPLLRELETDPATGQPVMENGDFRYVSGREAVKVWIWRALQPENARFVYAAHTGSYGNQLMKLAGLALPEAENRLARMVREALRVCPYITSVERFSFTREKSGLKAAFTVKTVYGALTAESEVTL
mgnify:FL=1